MGKSADEMRAYKAEWARKKRIKDPEWAEMTNKKCALYNKNVIRKGLDPYAMFDITGQRFGLLVITGKSDDKRRRGNNWICDCDCGTKGIIRAKADLLAGDTTHCGCVPKEINIKHGYSRRDNKSPEYETWASMKFRCSSEKEKNYFGRGISVCQRWADSFQFFLDDMGFRPSKKHTIERRNNDGNYEPDNCYWGTKKEQSNNRRSTIFLTFNNISLSIKGWSEKFNVKYHSLYYYIRERKLTIEEVVANGAIFSNK